MVDPDSSNAPTNLTNTAFSEWYPAWSPDGTRLAYGASLPSANWDTYVLNVSSPGTAIQVTNTPNGAESNSYPPVWSPGGTRIASVYHPDASNDPLGDEIIVSNADGSGGDVHVGTGPGMVDEAYPSYSPDGSKIMFVRDPFAVYTANSAGGDVGTAVSGGYGYDAKWSPDGTRVLTGTQSNQVRISRVDGTGTPVTLGTNNGQSVNDPEWSPDSSKVMWQRGNSIFVQSSDGSGTATEITVPSGSILGQGGGFSPDGTRVAFVGYNVGFSKVVIYVANSDGGGTPRIVADSTSNNIQPTWKPDPNAQPPVDPPVDPPVEPTRPPVTISLANFRKPSLTGGNHHMLLAGVSCTYPTPTAIAAGCTFGTNVITKGVAPAGNRGVAKKKPIVFAKGSTSLDYGEKGDLEVTITKAGRKLLKPGKKLKLNVTIDQHVGDDPVVTTKKTLKLKVPKKKGKK
ncbi:MAG: hypothetical protein U0R24_03910 [Solirubrobacterales bacterium]